MVGGRRVRSLLPRIALILWLGLLSGAPESAASGPASPSTTNYIDLIVDDIWTTTSPLVAGDSELIWFRVRNQGDMGFRMSFTTRLLMDGQTVAERMYSGLGPSSSVDFSVPVEADSAGTHQLLVLTDVTGVIDENNESNNGRTEWWPWQQSLVDLVVDDIWCDSNPLHASKQESVVYRIRNQGTGGTTKYFQAQLWVDGAHKATFHKAGLASGESQEVSTPILVTHPGLIEVKVIVDAGATVVESDETNNQRVEEWTWQPGQVDLIVEDVWPLNPPLVVGEPEIASFRIKNQGSGAIPGAFKAQLRLDGLLEGDVTIDGLAAGESTVRSLQLSAGTPGCHQVTVRADSDQVLTESDEGNNERSEVWDWYTPEQAWPWLIHLPDLMRNAAGGS